MSRENPRFPPGYRTGLAGANNKSNFVNAGTLLLPGVHEVWQQKRAAGTKIRERKNAAARGAATGYISTAPKYRSGYAGNIYSQNGGKKATRCVSKTTKGTRCKRTVQRGKKCGIHK